MKFQFLKYQLPTLLWAICILMLCTGPGGGNLISRNFFGIPGDKLAHAFLFCVMSFFIMMGIIKAQSSFEGIWKIRIIALVIASIYGLKIELIQHYFTSNRSGDALDLLADAIGAVLAWALFHLIYKNLEFIREK